MPKEGIQGRAEVGSKEELEISKSLCPRGRLTPADQSTVLGFPGGFGQQSSFGTNFSTSSGKTPDRRCFGGIFKAAGEFHLSISISTAGVASLHGEGEGSLSL